MLNEAFLERFPLTFEQEYPTPTVEVKMLNNYCKELNCCDKEFIDNLVNWADIIRKTFAEGGCDEVISTRRLVHVIRAFAIFNNRLKAIKLCLNRFDERPRHPSLNCTARLMLRLNSLNLLCSNPDAISHTQILDQAGVNRLLGQVDPVLVTTPFKNVEEHKE